jgi:hypothetical protein
MEDKFLCPLGYTSVAQTVMWCAAFNVNQLYLISLQSDKKLHELEEGKAEFYPHGHHKVTLGAPYHNWANFFAVYRIELKKKLILLQLRC